MTGRRAAQLGGVAAALVVAALVVAATVAGDDRAPLARAAALVHDAGGFDTGLEAGETFARVTELLLEDAEQCRRRHGRVPRCQGRSSAAAIAQIMAVEVLRCSAPGRFEARAAMAGYLERIDGLTAGATTVPPPPPPPDC